MRLNNLLYAILNESKNSESVIKELQLKGYEAMWAGGAVRDSILKKVPKDYDVVTSANPNEIIAVFKDKYKVLEVGKQFGVVVVIVDGEQIEVATYRKDMGIGDGRRPEGVDLGGVSAKEDALRRDFTINGLFKDSQGNIVDYVGGQEDLKNKIIKFIGEPYYRIKEDKLRMLRAVRFALKLDFTIDDKSMEAIQANAGKIKDVSWERISGEVFKMIETGKIRKMIKLLQKTNLLRQILPEIEAMDGVDQPEEFHPEGDVLEHTIQVAEKLVQYDDPLLVFAGLLHDVGKPKTYEKTDRVRFLQHAKVGADMARDICRRFKLTNKQTEHIGELVYRHMAFLNYDKMRKSKLKAYMAQTYFDDLMKLSKADGEISTKGSKHYDELMELKKKFGKEGIKPKAYITGKDLIKMGLKQGKELGAILKDIYQRQLEDEITSREEALKVARDEVYKVLGEE